MFTTVFVQKSQYSFQFFRWLVEGLAKLGFKMTRKCVVPRCISTHKTAVAKFYRFPTVRTHFAFAELSKRRVNEWKKVLGFRDCFNPNNKYICNLHFISGKAGSISNPADPDWVPTLGITRISIEDPSYIIQHDVGDEVMDTTQTRITVDQADFEAFAKGLLEDANLHSTQLSLAETAGLAKDYGGDNAESDEDVMGFSINSVWSSNDSRRCNQYFQDCDQQLTSVSQVTSNSTDRASKHSQSETPPAESINGAESDIENSESHQTELKRLKEKEKSRDKILVAYQQELARLQTKVDGLENELLKKQQGLLWIKDDKRCKLFTGISSFSTLKRIFEYVENCLFQPYCAFTKEQVFVMTLRKLRRNTHFVDLAEQYSVSTTTISKYFHRTLFVIYDTLKYALDPVSRDISIRHLPQIFRDQYGDRRVHIIDCFEIATEEPVDSKAALSHHSSYKMRETTKFLIAMSADGRVSFISHAYAGRCSDRNIAETSGFLDTLEPGDVVLADKGFDIADLISSKGAILNIPTFLRKDTQLNPLDMERDKQITALRVHVERLIGVLKSKYEYTNGLILVDSLRRFENGINSVDLAVWVCCILINFNKAIV